MPGRDGDWQLRDVVLNLLSDSRMSVAGDSTGRQGWAGAAWLSHWSMIQRGDAVLVGPIKG